MKKLLVLALVVAAGYFAYQKFVVGEGSEEVKQVQALADEFATVSGQSLQAERSAGLTGMDMTSSVDIDLQAVETLLTRLQDLRAKLTETKAVKQAEELEAKIRAFLNRG